jgi:predicted ribosomally synthesized peptide with nif11-like leader
MNDESVMSLNQLDSFLAHAEADPELASRLHDHDNPLDLEGFLDLASEAGYDVEEADVFAAQLRNEEALSDDELQRRAGEEARRLRHFILG